MSDPITNAEVYLAAISGDDVNLPNPSTNEEFYMARAAGMPVTPPAPYTNKELYWEAIIKRMESGGTGGEGVTIRNQDKTVTANGQYRADSGYTGLGTVTVNVPQEEPVVEPLEVTENGTYNPPAGVDGYGPVTVNVETAGGGDDTMGQFLDATLKEYSNEDLTYIRQYAFYNENYSSMACLESVSFPNVTSIGTLAFFNQSKLVLTSQSFPKVTSVGTRAFEGVNGDVLTFENITTLSNAPFQGISVTELRFPNATTGGSRGLRYAYADRFYIPNVKTAQGEFFQGSTRVTHICMPSLTAITNVTSFFAGCTALTAFILPGATMATIAGALALPTTSTYVYVPANLLETYKNATNWATIADSILAIEDSAEILQWLTDNGYEYEVTT